MSNDHRPKQVSNLTGAAFLVGSLLLLGPPAYAAQPRAQGPSSTAMAVTAKVAQAEPASAAKTLSDEDPTCSRARKRLWVDGEGWIVRRVTTCR